MKQFIEVKDDLDSDHLAVFKVQINEGYSGPYGGPVAIVKEIQSRTMTEEEIRDEAAGRYPILITHGKDGIHDYNLERREAFIAGAHLTNTSIQSKGSDNESRLIEALEEVQKRLLDPYFMKDESLKVNLSLYVRDQLQALKQ